MPTKTFVLALDDSGTRHPDRVVGAVPSHGNDWFSIGGVLFAEDDEEYNKFFEWKNKGKLLSTSLLKEKGFLNILVVKTQPT